MYEIYGECLTLEGNKQEIEFKVKTYTINDKKLSKIATLKSSGFK